MRVCSVPNCDRKHYGHGYCNKHYVQIYKYGTIISTNPRSRNDPNEIIVDTIICKMKLYSPYGEEVEETVFDLKYKEEIEKYKWHLGNHGYVAAKFLDENNKTHQMLLHQFIIYLSGKEVKDDQEIDHKDTNKLNNLEDNIRICTKSQNQQNKNIQNNNTSGYIGVTWNKHAKKWQAQIWNNGKIIHIGLFLVKEDAARAYNAAAINYHGDFAVLNIIP